SYRPHRKGVADPLRNNEVGRGIEPKLRWGPRDGGGEQKEGSLRMTKKEIVKQIADKVGLTQVETKEVVQSTFDAIIDAIASEGRIELRNFGVFEVKGRAPRKARNPRTGEP